MSVAISWIIHIDTQPWSSCYSNLGCYSVVPSDTMLRKGFAFVTAFNIIIIISTCKSHYDQSLLSQTKVLASLKSLLSQTWQCACLLPEKNLRKNILGSRSNEFRETNFQVEWRFQQEQREKRLEFLKRTRYSFESRLNRNYEDLAATFHLEHLMLRAIAERRTEQISLRIRPGSSSRCGWRGISTIAGVVRMSRRRVSI